METKSDMTVDEFILQALNATHEADDTALRLAVAETKIEALMQWLKSCSERAILGRRRPSASR